MLRKLGRRRFVKYLLLPVVGAVSVAALTWIFPRKSNSKLPRDRIPPGQDEVRSLEVLHVGQVPKTDINTWTFEVYGEVENPFKMGWTQFLALPKTSDSSDFHCVTGWTKLNNLWEGVRFKDVASLAKPTYSPLLQPFQSHILSWIIRVD